MHKGILYGVGVGPGDPELLTKKAIRILQEADIIAVPETGIGKQTALAIVQDEIHGKPILECPTPMIRDAKKLAENYDRVAEMLMTHLAQGKTIAFITLGDPTIYSTYTYIHKRVLAKGYDARFIPGIPSFCAVAATLNKPLCEGKEMLHIIPALHGEINQTLALAGNKIFMKAGKTLGELCQTIAEQDTKRDVSMVMCCGMPEEKVYHTMEAFQEEPHYFSIVLVKETADD